MEYQSSKNREIVFDAITRKVVSIRGVDIENTGVYVCGKGSEVYPKALNSIIVSAHFAHMPGSSCDCTEYNVESNLHLAIKKAIVEVHGGIAEISYPSPDGFTVYRADVGDPIKRVYHEVIVSNDINIKKRVYLSRMISARYPEPIEVMVYDLGKDSGISEKMKLELINDEDTARDFVRNKYKFMIEVGRFYAPSKKTPIEGVKACRQ